MIHILFVCAKNRLRSPTAEALFSGIDGIEVSSAGTSADADCPLSSDLLDWADTIVVMEPRQGRHIRKQFQNSLAGKRLVILNIPDNYTYMQEELLGELKAKASRWKP